MSPEQVGGQVVDPRADIFSFGVVLYEMITGVHPFKKGTPMETANAILNEMAVPLAQHVENPPVLLQHTVRKMLVKEPERRYQLVHDVRTDLGELLKEGEDSLVTTPAPTPSSTPWIPWGVAAMAIMIAATTAIWNPLTDDTRRELPGAKRFTIDLPTQGLLNLGSVGAWALALSPDGRHLVYVGLNDQGQVLYHRAMDAVDILPVPGTEGATDLFFSPDGEWVGFYADGKMKKVSLKGGEPVTICSTDPTNGASWGPDGNIIFGTVGRGLSRVSAAGGIPESLTTLDAEKGEIAHVVPDILPDGKAVLFDIRLSAWTGARYLKSSIGVLSLETGEKKTILEEGRYARYCHSGHLAYEHPVSGHRIVSFDLTKLAVTGRPVPNPIPEYYTWAIASREGTLVYRPPGERGNLVWVDRKGNPQRVMEATRRFNSPSLSPDGESVAVTLAARGGST